MHEKEKGTGAGGPGDPEPLPLELSRVLREGGGVGGNPREDPGGVEEVGVRGSRVFDGPETTVRPFWVRWNLPTLGVGRVPTHAKRTSTDVSFCWGVTRGP